MKKVLKILEWEKIVNEISKYAETSLGKEKILSLVPINEFFQIEKWHKENKEAFRTIYELGFPSFLGIKDIRKYLEKGKIGGIIFPEEFEDIVSTLDTWKRVRDYQEKAKNLANNLWGKIIHILSPLLSEIRKCIQNGEILDSASPELKNIRNKIFKTHQKIKETAEHFLQKEWKNFLQESIITIRHGRYVLPVKQEFRNRLNGIVHDQSTSGLTYYIEPLPLVELNNQLSILEIEEKKEIERILRRLTTLVLSHEKEILENLEITSYLDFVYAKLRWAEKYKCILPEITEKPIIILRDARHPFLGERAVPISLEVGKKFNTLVITGPNTGGKTVTLKTIGLFILLNQAGIPVPAKDGTFLGIFDRIFLDIGDEQSIEQNLSTFSSHLTNIIEMVEYLENNDKNENVLILLDELGAGTDPQEGSSLALALLEYFHSKGIINVIATHYPQLKIIATKYEGMENASMDFDEETLRPLYKISLGIPGKSNALKIAKRLGLSQKIIDRAYSFLSSNEIKVEDLIEELQKEKQKLQKEHEELNKIRENLEMERINLEKEKSKILEEKELLRNKETNKLLKEISQLEERVKEIIRKLQEESISMQNAQKIQKDIKELSLQIRKKKEEQEEIYIPHIGEKVKIRNSNKEGIILDIDGEKETALVQVGILRVNVSFKDLERSTEEKDIIVPSFVKVERKKYVPMEISIRQLTVDEGLEILKKYLEDAFLAGLPRVRIIHGRGTGKLKKAVHEYLSTVNYVKEFYTADPLEGGEGATIVILDKPS
ncbi:MAG: endonuclease MutS2 [Dictyoglomaceae bacterium]|nr:endonuclease MutS2 [Dictyoglomaceae bacterium]